MGVIPERQAVHLSPEETPRTPTKKRCSDGKSNGRMQNCNKMVQVIVGIAGTVVTIISIIVTVISIRQNAKMFKHQKSDRPSRQG